MKVVVTALAVLLTILVAPRADAVEATAPTSLRESFAAVPDGPAPATLVGTETPVTNFQGSEAATPYVRGGFLTMADPDTASLGSYRIAELASDVTRVGAEFAFTPYSIEDAVVCLSIQGSSIADSKPVPVSPVHLIVSPTRWTLDVNTEAGTNVDNVASGAFAEPLAADGATLHRVEIELDRASGRIRISLPDGSVHELQHPAFSLAGRFVYVESFKSPNKPPAGQTNALVREWWADSSPVSLAVPDPAVPAVPEPAPAPTSTVPAGAPVVVPAAVVPGAPRGVRAVRRAERTVVSWRRVEGAESYVVRCGTRRTVVDERRVVLRSTAARCRVRSVSEVGRSPWRVARVRF